MFKGWGRCGRSARGLGVTARDFGLRASRLGVPRCRCRCGARPAIAVAGPSGSRPYVPAARVTGRMRSTEGTAAVGGATLPRQMAAVRRASALAHVPGVTDLDPALTVGEHLLERALLQRRFGGSLRICAGRCVREPSGAAEGEAADRLRAGRRLGWTGRPCPKGSRTAVRDLERLKPCGCPSRWPSSAARGCSASTTPTSSCRMPKGPRSGPC